MLSKTWWMERQQVLLDAYLLGQIDRRNFIGMLDQINAGRQMIEELEQQAYEQDRVEFENAQS